MAPTLLPSRLSDSVREGERLKGKIEERDGEIVVLMRRLEVRGQGFSVIILPKIHDIIKSPASPLL